MWGAAEMAKAASSRVPAQPVMAVSTATIVRIPSRLTITGPASRSVARRWERRFKPEIDRAGRRRAGSGSVVVTRGAARSMRG